MSDDINPDVIKKTQDSLGKYIKRPPLTEKLLKKPPFRFLHDIITSIIHDTGFLQGVFTPEELNNANIKDRDSKIAFLQKAIDAVKTITGTQIDARPSKIVAGHEAAKTNEFLQAIAKALDKKLSSKEYVDQLNKTGKSKAPGKEAKEKKEKESGKVKSKSKLQSQDKTKGRDPAKKKSSSTFIENGKHSKSSGDTNRQETEKEKEKFADKEVKLSAGDKTEDKSFVEKLTAHESLSKESVQESFQEFSLDAVEATSDEAIQPIGSDPKVSNRESIQHMPHGQSAVPQDLKDARTELLEHQLTEGPSPKRHEKRKKSSRHKIAKAESSKVEVELNNLRKEAETPAEITVFGMKTVTNEPTPESPVLARPISARPRTARPVSARPAAPRIRDRGEVAVQEEAKPAVGKVSVITDDETTKEQDDFENFVVEAPSEIALDQPELSSTPVIPPEEEGQHGHLVAQILETKKELEDDSQYADQTHGVKKVEIEWEAGQKREKEMAAKEVERLRMSIQTLTRAANPLGKLMDFLQEDVDAMQRELEGWKAVNRQLQLQLVEEQSLTEESVKPLKTHLQQLDQNVSEKLAEISVVKGIILRNDSKIVRFLTGGVTIPPEHPA